MTTNPPKGVPQVYPRLAYQNATQAVDWLTEAFGLREREDSRLSDDKGRIALTEMELGSGLVMIAAAGEHGLESPATLGSATQMVLAYVDDVNGHYERAMAAGAKIVTELRDQPWGDRRYEALDVEGHRWQFAEHIRDVPADEWRRALSS